MSESNSSFPSQSTLRGSSMEISFFWLELSLSLTPYPFSCFVPSMATNQWMNDKIHNDTWKLTHPPTFPLLIIVHSFIQVLVTKNLCNSEWYLLFRTRTKSCELN
jgi:hypothetical protein